MTRADIIGGLLLAAGFGVVLWEASSFQYGTEFAPGPGFTPVWYSVIGIVISLTIAGLAWRSVRQSPQRQPDSGGRLDGAGLLRVGAALAGMTGMLMVASLVGLLPALLAFLLFLTLVVQRLPILPATGASLATVVFIYFVFVHFLGVPIPTGPLGF